MTTLKTGTMTCDANVIIEAALYIMSKRKLAGRGYACARILSRTHRLKLPQVALGEALAGVDDAQKAVVLTYAARHKHIKLSELAIAQGLKLRASLRKGRKSRKDCVIYAQAALAGSVLHISDDSGMSGEDNQFIIPARYHRLFGGNAPKILSAPKAITMGNPLRFEDDPEVKASKAVRAQVRQIKLRAEARARAAGARSEMDVVYFYANTAQKHLELHAKNQRKSRGKL